MLPLTRVSIQWFYEEGNSTGAVRTLLPNSPPDNQMFTATISILSLANFTFGPVQSIISIRNVDAGQEGIYSCADGTIDDSQSSRELKGCLFVLGEFNVITC